MPNQICFMVMPFGTKATRLEPGNGPIEIDFDSLWEHAYKPLLEEAGYEAIRADAQTGALIIQDMVEALAYSDLVMADVTIPNANVYYEIGVRHSARSRGCVLVSAEWANPVFDLRQIRRLTFKLNQERVDEKLGQEIKAQLNAGLEKMAAATSPVAEIIPHIQTIDQELAPINPGNPNVLNDVRVREFQDKIEAVQNLQAEIALISQMRSDSDEHKASKRESAIAFKDQTVKQKVMPSIHIELLRLLRDCAGWPEVLSFIDTEMYDDLRKIPMVREQRLLALSHTDSEEKAVVHLETLIDNHGPTSERYGLLGGRYKRLFQRAKKQGDAEHAKKFLNKSIKAYHSGMMQDLNDYYPTCNLPFLLKQRRQPGDIELAKFASLLAVKGCERAMELGIADEWVPQTLLTCAFSSEDLVEASRWTEVVTDDNHAEWKLKSTVETIEEQLELTQEKDILDELRSLVEKLARLIPGGKKRK